MKSSGKLLTSLLVISLVFWAICSLSLAATLETIPLDSWVYQVVDELHCQGFFPLLHTDVRPYTRGQIASMLLEINQQQNGGTPKLTDSQLWLLSKLNKEFRNELEELLEKKQGGTSQRTTIRYAASPVGHLTLAESDSSYSRLQLRFEIGLQFGDRFVLKDRAVEDNKAERERTYRGRKWRSGLTGVVDQGYANIDLKYLQLLLGRDHLRWGPGGDDVLLLSDQIPPFDMIKAEAQVGSFRLISFSTVLDQISYSEDHLPAKRYLSGHRVNMKLRFGVEMGFSEVVLYGGEHRNVEAHYLNPLLPYYGEQYDYSQDDNIMWSIDLTLSMFRNKEMYCELMIDDFQSDFSSEPHQIGYQMGINCADPFGLSRGYLNLEYTKIRNWVYGQIQPWNVYTYYGRCIGSVLGPDADRMALRLLYHLNYDIDLVFSGELKRKGEGRIGAFPFSAVPYPKKFPSGVVEQTNLFQLGFTYQPSANLKLDLFARYDRIRNADNQGGEKRQAFAFGAKLNLNLWKEKRL
jgi:hypothetical protein